MADAYLVWIESGNDAAAADLDEEEAWELFLRWRHAQERWQHGARSSPPVVGDADVPVLLPGEYLA
eukprot:9810582-Alexandrium_andersonii.AAC.1